MEKFGKLAMPHVLGMLLYSGIFRALGNMNIFIVAFILGLHVLGCFLFGIGNLIMSEKAKAGQFILISLLLLLLGFSTCSGLFSMKI